LHDTGIVQSHQAAKSISVNVTGKGELRLWIGNGGDGNDFDHADWADAKLDCQP
jgi:hypothetical protein